ncbi:MAG: hypothetical protein CVV53_04195 [Spirochaetae bacterium HGW-Spirochaetae-9]|nr:MAG: hypothetical protein CVV53_04195 [Spirochaetae bacterium HGW-Spirochaetae-9]
MKSPGKSLSCAALVLLVQTFVFTACSPSSQAGLIQRIDLFSVGYGLSENNIDLSSQGRDGIDLTMSQGIFHMLDGRSRKIMRLSSYGDLLALLYDPSISPVPGIVKPLTAPLPDGAKIKGQASAGRYAVPVSFAQPRKIAVGQDQTIYVADKVPQASARIYDPQSASYLDGIVRRFGAMGVEKASIGQEGPGGTPFPVILSMDVFREGTFGVFSASESTFLVHHFGKEGNLLSSLRIGRDALPLPRELSENAGKKLDGRENEAASNSSKIIAHLDGILMEAEGETFRIMLKLDYYKEYYDSASLVIARNEYAGSWIFTMDGWTGRVEFSLPITAGGQEAPPPELIGQNSGLYYLLYQTKSSLGSYSIQLMDEKGKVHHRSRIDLPDGVRETVTIRVSEEGQVYALLTLEEKVQVSLWDLR